MNLFRRFEHFYEKHERRISSFALLFGFIMDNLTLRRIDLLYDNLVILFYLTVAGVSILLLNVFEERRVAGLHPFLSKIHTFLPTVTQMVFGGLFSAFVVFYSRSASFVTSWPFMLILLGLLVGNEFFKKRYERLVFQVSIYFVALFSYFIFSVPMLLGRMGSLVFLLSGVVSMLAIKLFLFGLRKFVPRRYEESRVLMPRVIGMLFVLINALYFLNIIPPIPLSLKEAGAFHFIEKVAGGYRVVGEERGWYENLFSVKTLHVREGGSAYIFSAIFAPTRLQTSIVHHWYYYNKEKGLWVSSHKVKLPILGGRGGGYRLYSFKHNITPGLWRVNVETTNGLGVGRLEFKVERPEGGVVFEEEIL